MVETAKLFITIYCLKDSYHKKHAERVQKIALSIGEAIGLSGNEGKTLKYASLLHDIGKAVIPGEILRKKEPLSQSEWEIIKKHSVFGYELLRFFLPEVAEVIRAHHENWDGSGYPDGKKGEDIPLAARIIRVADSIDAALSERTYKQPKPLKQVLEEIISRAGKEYDPGIVRIFRDGGDKKDEFYSQSKLGVLSCFP